MAAKKQITPEQHREQIDQYSQEYGCYEKCAEVLKRVLERGCAVSFPEAFVQSRRSPFRVSPKNVCESSTSTRTPSIR